MSGLSEIEWNFETLQRGPCVDMWEQHGHMVEIEKFGAKCVVSATQVPKA